MAHGDDRWRSPGTAGGGGEQMANLIYSAIASLDGYVEDTQGGFEWAAPDEEVHAFVNDLERSVGIYLRRYLSVRAPHVRDDALLGDRRR
jgi:hypothetical protein